MIKKIAVFSCAAFLITCSNNTSDKSSAASTAKDTVKKTAGQPENELADFKFHTLVINIPSPFEIITLLPKSGVPFKGDLVNTTNNADKYTTSTKKALNYGSYIVDLVYLSSNERFSEVKNYFKISRTLAQSLDFVKTFDNIAGPARLEKNIDKKDTINKVIDEIYTQMDGYLRSNDRLLTATQILAGSWIESQYIAVSLLQDQTKNKENAILFQKVSEAGYSLDKLVQLLKEFENEKDFKRVIESLNKLSAIYKEYKINKGLYKDDKSEVVDKQFLTKLYIMLGDARNNVVDITL